MPRLKESKNVLQDCTVRGVIRFYMELRKISAGELAIKSHMNKRTLYSRLQNPETLDFGEARRIFSVLKVPVEEREKIGREGL